MIVWQNGSNSLFEKIYHLLKVIIFPKYFSSIAFDWHGIIPVQTPWLLLMTKIQLAKRLAKQLPYTANVYRQTTDKLMFKSVISTVR